MHLLTKFNTEYTLKEGYFDRLRDFFLEREIPIFLQEKKESADLENSIFIFVPKDKAEKAQKALEIWLSQ